MRLILSLFQIRTNNMCEKICYVRVMNLFFIITIIEWNSRDGTFKRTPRRIMWFWLLVFFIFCLSKSSITLPRAIARLFILHVWPSLSMGELWQHHLSLLACSFYYKCYGFEWVYLPTVIFYLEPLSHM